jgi:DNA processing protein
MSGGPRDARVLLLLCSRLPDARTAEVAPLSIAEWQRIGSALREAGLQRPGALLEVGPEFWEATGLPTVETQRLRCLLERGPALEAELERLEALGIRGITKAEEQYPERLRARLRGQSPPVIFAVGEWALLDRPALAIVGSRGVDAAGDAFAKGVAQRCARDGLTVVTGGARGVDRAAMQAALEAGGAVVAVMAGDLERTARASETRLWLDEGRLLLLSHHHPRVGFSIAAAMERNKVIYALAEYGLVVASAQGQGGTWAGAREVQRHGWVPLFVRDAPSVPDGNRELLRPGALPFPALEVIGDEPLPSWLACRAASVPRNSAAEPVGELFSLIWPRLATFLRTPRRLREVAEAFQLVPEQAEAWLRRAVASGHVEVEPATEPLYRMPKPPRAT